MRILLPCEMHRAPAFLLVWEEIQRGKQSLRPKAHQTTSILNRSYDLVFIHPATFHMKTPVDFDWRKSLPFSSQSLLGRRSVHSETHAQIPASVYLPNTRALRVNFKTWYAIFCKQVCMKTQFNKLNPNSDCALNWFRTQSDIKLLKSKWVTPAGISPSYHRFEPKFWYHPL